MQTLQASSGQQKIETTVPLKYSHLVFKCACAKRKEVNEYHARGKRCLVVWDPSEITIIGIKVSGAEPEVIDIDDLDLSEMSTNAVDILKKYDATDCVAVEITLPDYDGRRKKFYVNCRLPSSEQA